MSVVARFCVPVATLLSIGLLSACASDTTAADATSAAATSAAAGSCALTMSDAWVKAKDTEMTGAFGVIEQSQRRGRHHHVSVEPVGGEDGDPRGCRQGRHDGHAAQGGWLGGGGRQLGEPSSRAADHLMLMELPAEIKAGDEVEITVVVRAPGGSFTWTGVAKPFEGGAEAYVPAEGSTDSMSMSPSPSAN